MDSFAVEYPAPLAPVEESKLRMDPFKLESLVVDVNGERRRVDPKIGFSAVRGDLVTVVDVFVSPMTNAQVRVEIEGQKDRATGGNDNVIRRVVDTSLDLSPKGPLSAEYKSRYRIKVSVSGKLYGVTYMDLIQPELISFEVEVNNTSMKLRSGDRLSLGPHDGLKVLEIRTNVRGNENVKHDLITKSLNGRTQREIRFTRGSVVFARIPIDWKGS